LIWYNEYKEDFSKEQWMGLLPMDADILPPSDNRVFKLILTSPTAKPVLGRRVLPRIPRIVRMNTNKEEVE
jgi:hypothetical protein